MNRGTQLCYCTEQHGKIYTHINVFNVYININNNHKKHKGDSPLYINKYNYVLILHPGVKFLPTCDKCLNILLTVKAVHVPRHSQSH